MEEYHSTRHSCEGRNPSNYSIIISVKRFFLIFLVLIICVFTVLISRVLAFFRPFLPFAPYLLGSEKPTTYLVLLGNDAEMRANGGFTGSYAKINISSTSLDSLSSRVLEFFLENPIPKPTMELNFQDIYVPNGHIAGQYVEPPFPIQQAFGHGTWELANADWEPDFPSSAKSIRWFMEKGREINPDNLVLLNLTTIKKILGIVGSFPVPQYQATLTPDNLYLFLQGKAEVNFFPGSTQKKDALTAVGQAYIKRIKSLPLLQKIKIAQIIYSDLQNQNILVHSKDTAFQNFLISQNFAGVFEPKALDTFSIIETNLGANKSNAYVTRQTSHNISMPSDNSVIPGLTRNPSNNSTEKTIHHSATIKFSNSSIEANPNPPIHYGGNYIAYIRLYIPKDAQNIQLTRTPEGKPPLDLPPPIIESPKIPQSGYDSAAIQAQSNNYDQKATYGLTELGFWHTTTAGNESTIDLEYDVLLDSSRSCEGRNPSNKIPCSYSLAILKQHGIVTSPQTINLFGATHTTDLSRSFYLP